MTCFKSDDEYCLSEMFCSSILVSINRTKLSIATVELIHLCVKSYFFLKSVWLYFKVSTLGAFWFYLFESAQKIEARQWKENWLCYRKSVSAIMVHDQDYWKVPFRGTRLNDICIEHLLYLRGTVFPNIPQ